MNKKELTWDDVKKDLNFSAEQIEEIRIEEEIIEATVKARKKAKLTQRQLSEKTGIKQPAIARIERYKSSPQVITLIKLLYPLGYTLSIVPLKKEKK